MEDEIKEILSKDNIHIIECEENWCNAYGYEKSQLKEDLLDYITNLQEELKSANESITWWQNRFNTKNNGFKSTIEELCETTKKLEKLQEELEGYKQERERILNKLDYVKENERLNREVAKLHIIQEEYGNHIEYTHIIDDYQKTYYMSNKWLIELKNGKFVYIDDLNDKYEDYKSRNEKAIKYIEERKKLNWYADGVFVYELLNILNSGDE